MPNPRIILALCMLLAALPLLADPARQRQQFQQAWRAVQEGREAGDLRGLEDYPLLPYLAYERMRKAPAKVTVAQAEEFLRSHGDSLIGARLRTQQLGRLAASARHADFLRLYDAGSSNLELDCQAWTARQALKAEGDRSSEAQALLQRLDADHAACRPILAFLRAEAALPAAQLRELIGAAIEANRLSLARLLLSELPVAQRPGWQRRIQARADPNAALAQASRWPEDADSAAALAVALGRSARADPAAADARLATLAAGFPFDRELRQQVEREIARWAAVENHPQAERWIGRLPVATWDDNLHEWVVRLRLRRGELELALAALEQQPATLAAQPRWRYARARSLELLGRMAEARPLYAGLAREAHFHGFLAADRIGAAYAICPDDGQLDGERARVALSLPAIRRSLEWRALGDDSRARAEWFWLVPRVSVAQRRELGLLASQEGLHEWAIFTLTGDALMRQYEARFPLLHLDAVASHARRNQLDQPWVLGLIRAESAWNPNARSAVGARGLMQLMPGTAADVAKALGTRAEPLNSPEHNIRLGTRYLSRRLADLDDNPVLATAAYNAGIGAVRRWLAEPRPPWDLWIETVPFKETREYIARVLAFSVLYDWRLDGRPRRLSAMIPGLGRGDRPPLGAAPVECPALQAGD